MVSKLTNKQPCGILHFFDYLSHCEEGVGRGGGRGLLDKHLCTRMQFCHIPIRFLDARHKQHQGCLSQSRYLYLVMVDGY